MGFLLVIACAMDLLWFGGRFLQALTREEWKKKYFPDSEVMQTLHAEPEPGRLLVVDSGLDWRVQPLHPELFPNTPMRYGVRTVRGYSPSILKSFSEFINLIQGWPAEAFSDNSFPGWTATVNGTILKPMKVFHTFMAVPVPAGKSHVVWEFRPSHWSLYLLLSAAGIGLSLILSAIPIIRKQARQG
ncbi:MAG: YfhO family protein [Candidatus Omnitrophica bacterium]|nr:YfhO family protein [Candidatus Omnitrophota bacterium]